MNKIFEYALKFTGNTADAKRQVEQLKQQTVELGKEVKQFGPGAAGGGNSGIKDLAGKFKEAGDSVSSLKANIGGLGTLLTAGIGIGAVVGLATALRDAQMASDKLANQLKYVAGSSTGAAHELAYLRDTTSRIGLDFASAADAYAKFSASTHMAGISSESTRSVFEGVAKASATMGLSAEETSGALLALSQMASKGTVNAEELRGQLGERLPGAFALAAKAMGKTEAELGKMMETGQLMASDFLPRFGEALNREFSEPIKSLTAELNRFNSAWDLWKREMVNADGSSFKWLTNGLNESAAAMRALGKDAGVVAKIFAGAGGFEMGAIGVNKFDTNQLQEQAIKKLAETRGQREQLESQKSTYGSLPPITQDRLDSLKSEEAALRSSINELAVTKGKESGFKAPDLKGDFQKQKAQLDTELKAFLAKYKDGTEKAGDEIEKYKALMLKRNESVDPKVIADIQKKYAKKDGSGDLRSALMAETKASAEAEMKILQQQMSEAGDIYQRAYDQRLISARDFYTAQAALQDTSLAAQSDAVSKELGQAQSSRADAKGRGDIARATADITRLEGELAVITEKRGQVAATANAKTESSLKTLREKLDDVRLKLAETMGDASPEQIGEAVSKRYKDLLADVKLNAADVPGGVDLVNKMIDVETAKDRLAQIQSTWQRTMGTLSAEEQRINILKENSLISELDARTQILQLQRDAGVSLQDQIPMLDQLGEKYPQLTNQIAEMRNQWLRLSTVTDDWTSTFNGASKSALASFFTDATNRSKSFGAAAMDALNSIRTKMVNLAAEHLADEIFKTSSSSSSGGLLGMFGRMFGGLFGGSTASAASSSVPGFGGSGLGNGIHHNGGLIGFANVMRSGLSFSADQIAAAPRFHSGGVIGSNERLLVGQVGEEVLTANDPRHSNNGGGMAPEIHIHEAAGARVSEVKQNSNNGRSSIEIFLEQADGYLARNLIKGQGALTNAMETVGALSRGASTRGG